MKTKTLPVPGSGAQCAGSSPLHSLSPSHRSQHMLPGALENALLAPQENISCAFLMNEDMEQICPESGRHRHLQPGPSELHLALSAGQAQLGISPTPGWGLRLTLV